ncbi:response regulator transcription factor [Conexibacter woesei]|uniref:response regulator transcription factor n=1 Tax=Conexibacter woesei TaxID=191495 RepID=UPI00040EE584|nr:response regulator transcription factor [Conexibacter woesei]
MHVHGGVEDGMVRTGPLRVIVADDSYLVRQALEHVLADAEGIEVVAACGDRDTVLLAIAAHHPDVVVSDIRMPPTETDEGIMIAARLRETDPEIGVVILSQFTDPHYGLALLESGSDGRAYLLKERIRYRGQLVAAIESVAEGGSVIDAKVVEALVTARHRSEHSPLNQLTARELEILTFVARGHSNQAIADELVLTKRAVEKHINAIFPKLGLTDAGDVARRVKAALIYLSEQQVAPS